MSTARDSQQQGATFIEMFRRQARLRPDAVAVVDAGHEYSYAEVEKWSTVVASRMAGAGLSEGSRVLIMLPNGVEFVVTFLAASSIGALSVPINIRYRPDEMRAMVRSVRPHATVLAESFMTNPIADRLEQAVDVSDADVVGALRFLTGGTRPWAEPFPPHTATAEVQPAWVPREDVPWICYWTSGTTGDPKGVVHTNRLVHNVWNWTVGVMGYSPDDVLVSTRPFYYISGSCWSLIGALINGAKLVIAKRFSDAELLPLMANERATVMLGGPSIYYALMDSPLMPQWRSKLSFRTGFFGGTTVPPDFVRSAKSRLGLDSLVQVYGMTELMGFATSTLPTDPEEVTLRTLGRPLPGFELKLVDDQGKEVSGPDEPGELLVRGNVLAGYLRDGALVNACDSDGWFRTADLLSRRSDGNWVFHGRTRDMVKVRGENVLLAEVDAALQSIPQVVQASAFGAQNADGRDFHIEAVVQLRDAPDFSKGDVIQYCRAHLAPHKVPAFVWLLPPEMDWPITVSGKVQRSELPHVVERLRSVDAS